MTASAFQQPIDLSRSKRLKAATYDTHDQLDKSIMASAPFSSRERYSLFVKIQHAFHRDIDALYADPGLDALLPDLQGRRRLPMIEQDLADLGVPPLAFTTAAVFTQDSRADLPTALGWLYVAEGSSLGAAVLLKEAAKLDLSETFGARHLAGAPEGRGLHWRTFTAALDTIDLSQQQDAEAIAGATAAFDRVQGLVNQVFSSPR